MKSYPERRYFATSEFRAQLAKKGRRADWLAAQIGVKPSHLSKVFGGTRRLSEVQARIAAGLLDVDFFVLFESPTGNTFVPDRIDSLEPEKVPA